MPSSWPLGMLKHASVCFFRVSPPSQLLLDPLAVSCGLLCQCPHHPPWMQTGCEHRSQTGLHSCAEREEKVAGLNLLSLFGRRGAGAAL